MTQGVADIDSLVTALLAYTAVSFVVLATVGYALYAGLVVQDAGPMDESLQRSVSITFSATSWASKLFLCNKLGISSVVIRRIFGLLFIMLVFVPFMLNIAITLGAVMLVAAEGWSFYDSFVYIWQDTFSIGPFVDNSPSSVIGSWLDMAVSLLVFILAQVVLGIAGGLDINNTLISSMPATIVGLLRVVFIYSPLGMVLIVFAHAAALAFLEGWDFSNSVAFVVDILCNIENGLTDDSPTSASSLFLSSLFLGVTLCAAGSLITVVGSHPVIVSFVERLNGQFHRDPEECGDDPQAPQGEVADEVPAQEPEAAGGIETRLADIEAHLHRIADAVSRTPTPPCTPVRECRARGSKSCNDWLGGDAPDADELDTASPWEQQWPQAETPSAVQADNKAIASTGDPEFDSVKIDEEVGARAESLSALLAKRDAELAALNRELAFARGAGDPELQRLRTELAARDEEAAAKDAELRRLQAALSSRDAELILARRALEASHQRELKLHSANQANSVDLAPGLSGHVPSPWSTDNFLLQPVEVLEHDEPTARQWLARRPGSASAPVLGIAAFSGPSRF